MYSKVPMIKFIIQADTVFDKRADFRQIVGPFIYSYSLCFYSSLHHWNEPVLRSIPLVEQMGIKPVTPLLGQVFHKESETDYWWENL